MKMFETPEIDIILLNSNDAITVSGREVPDLDGVLPDEDNF